jgi:hypothetical protein
MIVLPSDPHSSGTSAEVYHGTQNGESMAVKVLRTPQQESATKLMKVSTSKQEAQRMYVG